MHRVSPVRYANAGQNLSLIHISIYGVDAEIYAAELRFDALYSVRGGIPVYQPLPKVPAVTRDRCV